MKASKTHLERLCNFFNKSDCDLLLQYNIFPSALKRNNVVSRPPIAAGSLTSPGFDDFFSPFFLTLDTGLFPDRIVLDFAV